MSFRDIKTNPALVERMRTTIKSGNVAHAYIVEGPLSVDKKEFAVSMAQALLCREEPGEGCGVCPLCRRIAEENHLDVTMIEGSAKKGSSVTSIRDEDMIFLQERLSAKPVEGDRSIAIVEDADSITARAFNRLLKTLEEPAPGTVILLLSENMNLMPPTIRSRCVKLRMTGEDFSETGEMAELAEDYLDALLEGAPYYRYYELLEAKTKEREKALLFLDTLEGRLRERIKDKPAATVRDVLYALTEGLEQARSEIKRGDRPLSTLKKMTLNVGGK